MRREPRVGSERCAGWEAPPGRSGGSGLRDASELRGRGRAVPAWNRSRWRGSPGPLRRDRRSRCGLRGRFQPGGRRRGTEHLRGQICGNRAPPSTPGGAVFGRTASRRACCAREAPGGGVFCRGRGRAGRGALCGTPGAVVRVCLPPPPAGVTWGVRASLTSESPAIAGNGGVPSVFPSSGQGFVEVAGHCS